MGKTAPLPLDRCLSQADGLPRRTANFAAGRRNPQKAALDAGTFPFVYGMRPRTESGLKGVRPSVNKAEFVARWNRGRQKRFRTITAELLRQHRDGKVVLFYFGNGWHRRRYTLVMVDIDVQKALGFGSTEGAVAFAEYLERTYFPGAVWETSTNGRGVHLYILLDKFMVRAEEVNAGLDGFQFWLRERAEEVEADIEAVEVKGRCPVMHWSDGSTGTLDGITYGQFAKVPVSDVWDTAVVTFSDLRKNYTAGPPKNKPHRAGSLGHIFTPDKLAALPEYEKLWPRLFPASKLKTTGRVVALPADFAIFCLILLHIDGDMNRDGTIPMDRIKGLWDALHKSGDVSRPYNVLRVAAIREHLGHENKYIQTVDPTYWFATGQKGRACRWHLAPEFAELLADVGLDPLANNQKGRAGSIFTPEKGGAERDTFSETCSISVRPFAETCYLPVGCSVYAAPVFSATMRDWVETVFWRRVEDMLATFYETST